MSSLPEKSMTEDWSFTAQLLAVRPSIGVVPPLPCAAATCIHPEMVTEDCAAALRPTQQRLAKRIECFIVVPGDLRISMNRPEALGARRKPWGHENWAMARATRA